ncbi:MAG: nicotinate-nucleotide--dimethylbenzimidazole phosphoribosyltransferase [Oscillospiraceae bacterium]|nr:nicotinate-nucleotide--dimethylbenzimidazole phosphoribosyltransferase [Oscillospiraceae bacterium]
MEYSEKRVSTGEEERLRTLQITPPDKAVFQAVLDNWDQVAKPLDGLGVFEPLTAQIGAIQGTANVDLSQKGVLIFCADNGIVEERISQSGQEVTLAVLKSMAKGQSSVCKMASHLGAATIPVDIGVNSDECVPGVVQRKIRRGTRNFFHEPAMTKKETLQAIFTGMALMRDCKAQGYTILALGEMGIGNTTTSSAVAAALLSCDSALVTGRGAGLNDEKLHRKQQVIAGALSRYGLFGADPLEILSTVGGLDLAGLTGACIGGAVYHVPVVLDGVITMTAALCAERLVPGVKDYLLPSHKGREPAVKLLADALGLLPVIDGDMALGEGTGAVMMLSLLDMVLCLYRDKTAFADLQMDRYQRYDKR